ncbi:MAG: TatD family hydrolase [Candidatus Micrarchaeia archaeon]
MYGFKTAVQEISMLEKSKTELADAHCHLDMIDQAKINESLEYGVSIMIANGGTTKSNLEVLKLADQKHIFAAIGISPDVAASLSEEELSFNINLARANAKSIKAIGEIGLDFKIAKNQNEVKKQKSVFEKFVELAIELDVPVCVHSRNAIEETLRILKERNAKKVQLHFFEGDEEHAKIAAENGYFISVPPQESSKRNRAIREFPISQIMTESDAPAAGSSPKDVEKSVMIIAKAKGIDYQKAAEQTVSNTKRFFKIGGHKLIRIAGS